jgi:Icc-related predicted phosphoesterase
VRLVCLSDTHEQGRRVAVPDGDVLVHAGDLTFHGALDALAREADWLRSLPHPHKIVIAGNHDFAFQLTPAKARAALDGLTYLEDAEATVAGLRFWGSPWQPWFHDWAFNLERGPAIRAKWDLVPAGVDVLVTHGPPAGHGDRVVAGDEVGCADLLDAIHRVKPRVNVFGHIHEGHGVTEADGTRFVNASICDVRYRPVQGPIVVDVD